MKKLFKPETDVVSALRWSKYKTLGHAKGAWVAACYAIHRCHLARYTTDSEWCPLWSQMMGSLAKSCGIWATVKDLLIENRVLECDGKPKHGVKSYSFRLGPALAGVKWKLSAETFPIPDVDDGRQRWPGLAIDKPKAHGILEEIAPGRGWCRERLECWHYRVDEFSNAYSEGKTGRHFGDANQLPSEVRDALTIHGSVTAEIDIANSQPLFLATLYPNETKEKRRYLDLAGNGAIYEFFGGLLGMDRSGAKDRFAPWLFGARDDEFAAAFTNEFPELASVIAAMRKQHYKALAFDLQEKEAEVILDACERFDGVSIHDGIRVEESNEPAARVYVLDSIASRHGLAASLK